MTPDRRITLVTAIATFVSHTAVTVVVWALTRPDVPAAVQATQASVAAVQQPVSDGAPSFERISAEELKALIDKDQVIVIDVRSAEQFVAAHVKGALHIPVASIEGETQYLPKNRLVVTYCTCPAEESSGEAAMILQRHGIPAKALLGGLGAWTTVGYPTAAGVK
jgi:rhodanese-related sulfurtransferase